MCTWIASMGALEAAAGAWGPPSLGAAAGRASRRLMRPSALSW